ncbi:hypothetical protein LguiA_006343 [Lonicera macranthoides]
MKFGKEFRIHLEETLPEWRDKYLCYKPLKKLLKNLPPTTDEQNQHPPPPLEASVDTLVVDPSGHVAPPEGGLPPLAGLEEWFVNILSDELEKFNDFYVEKEEDFIIRFQKLTSLNPERSVQWVSIALWYRDLEGVDKFILYANLEELKERIERVKEKSCKDGLFTSESEFSDEVMDIRKDFVTIHGEMVLLKNYSSLNFAGLIKILKKYDKRTGGLLRLPFTQLALHQPFFTTEPLTRLVRECEANLEVLFPVEAEVIESSSISRNPTPTEKTNIPSEATPSSLAEETVDVYRMTLAAIRTIKGLKRESSTYNPLSFASIFGSQDNDSTGAVTAENSSGEEANQDDAGSTK